MRYSGLARLTRLTFVLPEHEVDEWLQTSLSTCIGTPNSLRDVILWWPLFSPGSRDEWNTLDVILSNASCIPQVYLSLVALTSLPILDARTPELLKEYIPNLMERGGFSLWGYERSISLPHRQIGHSTST